MEPAAHEIAGVKVTGFSPYKKPAKLKPALPAAEKGRELPRTPEKHSSGAKALPLLSAFCGTTEVVPCYKTAFFRNLFSRAASTAKSTRPLGIGCLSSIFIAILLLFTAPQLLAQSPAADSTPIAIVPLSNKNPDAAAKVTGALEVSQGKAIIVASGTITSGGETTEVVLPHRGLLRVCASTAVKLAADTSVPAGETPGLMMAMDHGAIEASFATGRNSDILLTPDFRILIGGLGAAEVKIRLGEHGDTCVDNAGANAPYVLVTGVFDGGNYRVQPGQRVMFEHGSLREVVDHEKESCGCPPPLHPGTNEFPVAESAGLAPTSKPAPNAISLTSTPPESLAPLVYNSADHAAQPAPEAAQAPSAAAAKPAAKKKSGFLGGIGKFFRRIFGAE